MSLQTSLRVESIFFGVLFPSLSWHTSLVNIKRREKVDYGRDDLAYT